MIISNFLLYVAISAPNVVIFLVDDLGYGDLQSFGNPTMQTPNIDFIEKTGVKLTQFYVNSPICTPSRSGFLTGRLPLRSGMYTNHTYPLDNYFRVMLPTSSGCLPETEQTLPSLLPKNYKSKWVGKWHNGHNGCLPHERGFDSWFGLPYSHEEGPEHFLPQAINFPPVPLMRNSDIVQQPFNQTELTARYVSESLDFIEDAVQSENPFFLFFAFEEPHFPVFSNPAFSNKTLKGVFGDAVSTMDAAIGCVLNSLKNHNIWEETIVIFTSDNGAWTSPSAGLPSSPPVPEQGGSTGGLRGQKGSTWEGGLRVPFLLSYPNTVPQAKISRQVVSALDILPTILEWTQASGPTDVVDGKSMTQHFEHPERIQSRTLFFWRETVLFAIRIGAFKGHFWTRPGFGSEPPKKHNPILLFNVEHDPYESIPLNVTKYEEVVKDIMNAKDEHLQTIKAYPQGQYDMQDWKIRPCCDISVPKNACTCDKTKSDPSRVQSIVCTPLDLTCKYLP